MCKISIIIPSYNSAKYLLKCLDSCFNQTFSDYEIIVVNDGSTDHTIDVVKKYIDEGRPVNFISKKNEGLVLARRSALEKAKGEFVFFVDADDVIEPDTLERLTSISEGADMVIGGILIESINGKKYPIQHVNKFAYGTSANGMLCNFLMKTITPSLCGRLVRRKYLLEVETPSGMTIGEDVITNLLLFGKNNLKVILDAKPLYHYIQYPSSMLNSKDEKTLRKRLQYLHWVVDFFHNKTLFCVGNANECLSHFILLEFYSFFRDGGFPAMDRVLSKDLFTKYWNKEALRKLSIWQSSILIAFRCSPVVGKIYRNVLVGIRNLIYKFKL